MLSGIIPPIVTPFDEAGRIDEDALRADVRYLIERAGVHGLAVCGSTGEGHTLSTEETRRVTSLAIQEAGGRVPVIAGIIVDSTRQAIKRARAVADLGPEALQVTPVHYLFRPDDDSMLRHFAAVAEAVPIPVIIYNVVPWSYLSPKLLVRIMKEVPGVIGVKQSAGDMKALADLLALADDRMRIFSAVDALLYPSFALGAHGSIAALLTAVPEWSVALWDAVRGGDHLTALYLHGRMLTMWNAIDGPNLPANVKTAMTMQGRKGGFPRAPMPVSSPEQTARVGDALAAGTAARRA